MTRGLAKVAASMASPALRKKADRNGASAAEEIVQRTPRQAGGGVGEHEVPRLIRSFVRTI